MRAWNLVCGALLGRAVQGPKKGGREINGTWEEVCPVCQSLHPANTREGNMSWLVPWPPPAGRGDVPGPQLIFREKLRGSEKKNNLGPWPMADPVCLPLQLTWLVALSRAFRQ